ncbi:F7-2 fimbrial protein, partial [Escherichia coli]|nr:F7-2 fimbrial protein [Escherichia coli]MDK6311722.1 F7-2 fimbrial protein [Escherichia coli]MDX8135001.1 F7-2 fimbrial protein [Escherichia coli]MDZ6707771.1 F7-2 fimbrial protein [Escherichia coli]
KRVFLVILFTSFSGSLVSRIPGAVQDGDNVLHYTAIVKKSSANNAQVTEGAFSAVATFNLSYQ